jgi:hypothetical protein
MDDRDKPDVYMYCCMFCNHWYKTELPPASLHPDCPECGNGMLVWMLSSPILEKFLYESLIAPRVAQAAAATAGHTDAKH